MIGDRLEWAGPDLVMQPPRVIAHALAEITERVTRSIEDLLAGDALACLDELRHAGERLVRAYGALGPMFGFASAGPPGEAKVAEAMVSRAPELNALMAAAAVAEAQWCAALAAARTDWLYRATRKRG